MQPPVPSYLKQAANTLWEWFAGLWEHAYVYLCLSHTRRIIKTAFDINANKSVYHHCPGLVTAL